LLVFGMFPYHSFLSIIEVLNDKVNQIISL
jgi:hypothetical protein